jgi:hypothetical protein
MTFVVIHVNRSCLLIGATVLPIATIVVGNSIVAKLSRAAPLLLAKL